MPRAHATVSGADEFTVAHLTSDQIRVALMYARSTTTLLTKIVAVDHRHVWPNMAVVDRDYFGQQSGGRPRVHERHADLVRREVRYGKLISAGHSCVSARHACPTGPLFSNKANFSYENICFDMALHFQISLLYTSPSPRDATL